MLKKILPLLLVIVMVLGFGTVAAFADEEELPSFSDGTADGTIQADGHADVEGNIVKIGKTLIVENAHTVHPKETFYLVQIGKTSTDSSVTGNDIPDLVLKTDPGFDAEADGRRLVGVVTFEEGEVKNLGTGEETDGKATKDIEIELPIYTAVGVYTYTLKEVDNKTAGMDYWQHNIKLVITVMVNDDGLYYVSGVHCEEVIPDTPADERPAKAENFENTYRANSGDPETGGIKIEKEVTGNLGDREKYFEFTITFKAEDGMNYTTAPKGTVNETSYDGNPDELDFTGLAEEDLVVKFYLKHGESIYFGNVPYGVGYEYSETDYTSDGYDTTYPLKDSGELDPETGDPVMVEAKSDVVDTIGDNYKVTNHKNQGIDTGVLLDNLPYVLMLALVLTGGIVFFVSKKRKRAENLA